MSNQISQAENRLMDRFTKEGELLSEQFKSLKDNHRTVLDWWQKQLTEIQYGYRGVSHIVNKLIADRQQLEKKIQELNERCETLKAENSEKSTTIGQLQSDLLVAVERLDRLADWANKQRGIEK